jgi:hypothetical protein
MLQADLREHLERLDCGQADVLVFSSPAGRPGTHSPLTQTLTSGS